MSTVDLDAWAEDIVGKVIADKYEVMRVLGIGGMGGVFLGRHRMLGDRLFALKLIVPNPHAGTLNEQEKRFAREAATALTFVHPRAVQVREFGLDRLSNVMYMAMDYVEGRSLSEVILARSQRIQTGEPVIELERALKITLMILDCLEAAHAAGVCHRDIKPSNIMLVTEDGEEDVRVVDFGFAKVREAASGQGPGAEGRPSASSSSRILRERLTLSGSVIGTPQYMAPEQARGEQVDHRADLYSTGVVLYEMLTGALPHGGSSFHTLLFKRATEPPVPIEKARPDLRVPDSVKVVLDFALAKEPENRFADAAQFAQTVADALGELEQWAAAAPRRGSGRRPELVEWAAEVPRPVEEPAPQALAVQPPERVSPRRSRSRLRRPPVRRRNWPLIGAAAAVLLGAVILSTPAIRRTVRFSTLMKSGRTAMAARRYQDALGEFQRALALRAGDPEATELANRARLEVAVSDARKAVEDGDVEGLCAAIEAARNSGGGKEVEDLEAVLSAAQRLGRVGELLERRSFSWAGGVLEGLPVIPVGPWAAKAENYRAIVERELGEGDKLLKEAKRLSAVRKLKQSKLAEEKLHAFLRRFPHHPLIADAKSLLGEIKELEARVAKTRAASLKRRDKASEEAARAAAELKAREAELARAKEAEEKAFRQLRKLRDSGASLTRSIQAASEYLSAHAESAHAGQVSAWLAEDLLLAEKGAFEAVKSRVTDSGSDSRARIDVARNFLRDYPDSKSAPEASALLKKWEAASRVAAEERKASEEILSLLDRDDVPVEERVLVVKSYVNRFWNTSDVDRIRETLKTHLVRRIVRDGRLSLADSASGLRAALLFGEPAHLGIYSLNTGQELAAADTAGEEVISISLGPGGRVLFAGTRSGTVLRWRLSAEGTVSAGRRLTPKVLRKLRSPARVVIALGERHVLVAGGGKGGALLTLGDDDRPALSRPVKMRGRVLCGARSGDRMLFALGDNVGNVAAFRVGSEDSALPVWRTALDGPVKAISYSGDRSLVAASWTSGEDNRTRAWSITGRAVELLAEYRRGSPWLQILDSTGHLLIGGVVVGPDPADSPVALRVGAACSVDPSGSYLVAATATGQATICYLPELLRQTGKMRKGEGAR